LKAAQRELDQARRRLAQAERELRRTKVHIEDRHGSALEEFYWEIKGAGPVSPTKRSTRAAICRKSVRTCSTATTGMLALLDVDVKQQIETPRTSTTGSSIYRTTFRAR